MTQLSRLLEERRSDAGLLDQQLGEFAECCRDEYRAMIRRGTPAAVVEADIVECLAAALVLDREGHRMLAARAGRRAVVAESVLSGLRRLEVA